MTDEEIAKKMPAGYYRVDKGTYQEGDLVLDAGVSHDKFEPVEDWGLIDRGIYAPLVVARPMHGYHDKQKKPLFPEDAEARKEYPVGTFIRDYFPHAIAALAHHSYLSQQQHGPASNGAPMEWIRDASIGDGNQIMRHFMEGDSVSTAWRALEDLERELTAPKL